MADEYLCVKPRRQVSLDHRQTACQVRFRAGTLDELTYHNRLADVADDRQIYETTRSLVRQFCAIINDAIVVHHPLSPLWAVTICSQLVQKSSDLKKKNKAVIFFVTYYRELQKALDICATLVVNPPTMEVIELLD
jgi:hypothetical protein